MTKRSRDLVVLAAQARYVAGTREILESFFAGTPIRPEYLIGEGGRLAGTAGKPEGLACLRFR
ncbi:hypothetical protein [Mycobacterium interjectum]|uniref:hypothetical protein n=1 Tax=Mycobacterium interjectum TaxID=33895 RepID=UPI001155F78B|nr:hypothetical protein [Mycobacterium interjectum]MCV7092588.1 hypothetical protein [Mycobacterium interjectum]